MANTRTTPNMGLIVPLPGIEVTPLWAPEQDAAWTAVDAHDHSPTRGVKVSPSGLNISAALDFNPAATATGNDAIGLRSARFTDQLTTLAASADVGALYLNTGDLWFRNGGGTNVQLTVGGAINSSASVSIWTRLAVAGNLAIDPAGVYIYLDVDTSVARTITLPLGSAVGAGRYYVILDRNGTSGTNAITLAPNGGAADTIDGVNASISLSGNYGAWIVVNGLPATPGAWRLIRCAPINLASSQIFGVLAQANLPAATAGVTGIIQLAGDLAGTGSTAAAPAVGALTGAAAVLSIRTTAPTLQWAAGTASPTLTQATAGAGSGQTLTVQAQDGNTRGGDLVVRSGADGSAAETASGDFLVKRGSKTAMKLTGDTTSLNLSFPLATAAGAGTGLLLRGQAGITSGAGGGITIITGAGTAAGASGDLALNTGSPAGASLAGQVAVGPSGGPGLRVATVAASQYGVSIGHSGALTSTEIPTGVNGFLYLRALGTAGPTGTPSGGPIVYGVDHTGTNDGMMLGWRGAAPGGTTTKYGFQIDDVTQTATAGAVVFYLNVMINGSHAKIAILQV